MPRSGVCNLFLAILQCEQLETRSAATWAMLNTEACLHSPSPCLPFLAETDAFLHASEEREVSACAAECGALLKATAATMELGSRTETFNLSM